MKRKILAIMTAAFMLFTSTAFAEDNTEDKTFEYTFNKEFAENYKVNEMPEFSDVKTLSKELDLLVRLHVISGYEDGTLKLDRIITRAEAARMFSYAVYSDAVIEDIETQYTKEGLEEIKKDYARAGIDFEYNGFSDVDLMTWYHPYVYAAKNLMNCISGYDDGTFRPENTVTEIEFLTMLERALGYTDMIEAEGGYPNGVIAIGNRLNLIDNPSAVPATRERAASMIYNALHSYVVLLEGYALNESGTLEARFNTSNSTLLDVRFLCKAHGTIKQSSLLPEKTVVFVPDDNYTGRGRIRFDKGKEYTLVKEYSDITEGEYDVYINFNFEGEEKIVAAF